MFARDDPEISADDFEWPELDDAISGTIRSDGHGRLYVYPIFARPPAEEPAQEEGASEGEDADEAPQGRPVDVYSPEGDLIVAGRASGGWTYARGDYVYRFRRDPDTDETLVVRLRLVLRPESVSGGE